MPFKNPFKTIFQDNHVTLSMSGADMDNDPTHPHIDFFFKRYYITHSATFSDTTKLVQSCHVGLRFAVGQLANAAQMAQRHNALITDNDNSSRRCGYTRIYYCARCKMIRTYWTARGCSRCGCLHIEQEDVALAKCL
jgi:hypothetical protein